MEIGGYRITASIPNFQLGGEWAAHSSHTLKNLLEINMKLCPVCGQQANSKDSLECSCRPLRAEVKDALEKSWERNKEGYIKLSND